MLFICHPTCSTCEKARAFLQKNGLVFEERDIREQRPTLPELKRWHRLSGLPLKKLFNTSGLTYRALGLSRQLPGMAEAAQLKLLAGDGMLVKRPVLVSGDSVFFGFDETAWTRALMNPAPNNMGKEG